MMNFGLVVLIAVCVWSALAIVASLTFGGMASERDREVPRRLPQTKPALHGSHTARRAA